MSVAAIASQRELAPLWTIEPEWKGETVFIIGGGPSVARQNINLLRGRHVIAINTSYGIAPWADYLLFSDDRWWRHHEQKIVFSGRIVSLSRFACGKIWRRLNRRQPPGMSDDRDTVTVKWTTLTAAIDMAAHLGVSRIVLLGADGKLDGKRSHHHEPHPWPCMPANYGKQRADLSSMVLPLQKRGIEVLNASPGSALDLWPMINLQTVI